MPILIINRYCCPRTTNQTVQALELDVETMQITKTYPKMLVDDNYLSLFKDYKKIIICDVSKVSMLDKLTTIINNGE